MRKPKRPSLEQNERHNGSVENCPTSLTCKNRLLDLYPDVLVALFLCLITFAAYAQVLNNDFLSYDDTVYVTENHNIQNGLNFKTIAWSFTTNVAGNWHPLTLLSHMIDCQLYGLNAGAHHITSLCIHMVNTLLLFLLFRKMTFSMWKSAFIAALFAIHPLHVESVAWVSERKDVLSTFFWMLTMLAYCRYVQHSKIASYMLALFFFVLGLMAKPMLVTLPFVLLLMDYWPLRRFSFNRPFNTLLLIEKIPFFIFSAVSSIITYLYQQKGEALVPSLVFPFSLRIENALVSYVNYIGNFFWPFNLSVLYPHEITHPWWEVSISFLFLALLSVFAVIKIQTKPYITIGWLWYLGTLVPVIGLVQVGSQAMADRYTYVPTIGLSIIAAWGAYDLMAQCHFKKMGLALVATAFIGLLFSATVLQVTYWSNNATLFAHSIKSTRNNHISHNNLGLALAEQGNSSEAIRHYEKALEIYPRFAKAHFNLGNVLYSEGKFDEAAFHFSNALSINPRYADAHNGLGLTLGNKGNIEEAMTYFSEALKINPNFAEAHNNLGVALMRQGSSIDAISHFRRAIEIKPDVIHFTRNLNEAMMLLEQQMRQK